MGRVQMSGQEGRPTPTVPNALDAPGIASRRTAAQQQQASLNQRYEFVRFLEYFKEKKLKPPHDKFVHDINRQVLTHAISFEEYTTTLKKTLNEIWPEIIREFQGHMVKIQQAQAAQASRMGKNLTPPTNNSPYAKRQATGQEDTPIMQTPHPTTETDLTAQNVVNSQIVRKRVEAVASKSNITTVDEQVSDLLCEALNQRIRDVLHSLVDFSNKRTQTEQEGAKDFSFIITSDARAEVRMIEKREREIQQKKDDQEKERLLEA